MASYFNTTISLNEKDLKKANALKKKGFKIIDIFRAGLEDVKARSPKKLF